MGRPPAETAWGLPRTGRDTWMKGLNWPKVRATGTEAGALLDHPTCPPMWASDCVVGGPGGGLVFTILHIVCACAYVHVYKNILFYFIVFYNDFIVSYVFITIFAIIMIMMMILLLLLYNVGFHRNI